MAQPSADARRHAPRPIDLGGVGTSSPGDRDPLQLIGTAAAETAVGVSGVHHLGGTAARGLDRASRAVLGRSTSPGVTVSQIDGVTTVDLDLVADYPTTVTEVAARVQDQVSHAVTLLTDQVVVVNVTVTDVFGPYDRDVVAETDAAIGSAVDTGKRAAAEARRRATDAAAHIRERTADAADRLDAELQKRGAKASTTTASAEAPEVTVVVADTATVTVDAGSDVTVRVDSNDDADVTDGTTPVNVTGDETR